MLHIKYRLDKSHKHGIGLFADQDIRKGEVIYTSSPLLDLNISNDTFEKLTQAEKDEIRYWGFWIESQKVWHVDFDMSKFLNDSFDANTSQDFEHEDAYLLATRGIQKGEELTQHYLEFESEEDLKRRGIDLEG